MKIENPILKKILQIIGNPFYVKVYFVVMVFLSEIPIVMRYFNPLLRYGLVLSVVVILADLLTERRVLNWRLMWPLLFIILSYAVTLLFHRNEFFTANVVDYFFMVALFLVMFPTRKGQEKASILREMSVINMIMVGLTTLAGLFSIYLFLVQYQSYYEFNNLIFPVGFVHNRLGGLYRNAIYPTNVLGILAGVIQWSILNKENYKWAKLGKVLISIVIVVNLLQLSLANARALILTLAGTALIVVFFHLYRKMKNGTFKIRKIAVRGLSLLVIPILAATAIFAIIEFSRFVMPYVPVLAQEQLGMTAENLTLGNIPIEQNDQQALGNETAVNIEREGIPEDMGLFTGRLPLWRDGIQAFLANPILGYGAYTLGYWSPEGIQESWIHLHNVYLHALVAMGLLGALPLFFFLGRIMLKAGVYLFKKTKEKEYHVVLFTFALLVLLLVNNLSDTTILFFIKQSGFLFWIYLGYIYALTKEEEK